MSFAASRFINLPCVLAGLLLAAFAASPVYAQRGRFSRGEAETQTRIETNKGFLFVNGVYLEPPYEIELGDNVVRINGEEYAADSFDLSEYPNRTRGLRGGGMRSGNIRGDGGNRGMRFRDSAEASEEVAADSVAFSQLRSMIREINMLKLGAVVVLQQDRPPMVFWPNRDGHTLLETLIVSQAESRTTKEISVGMTSPSKKEALQQFVAQFVASPEFLTRAKSQVESVNALDRSIEVNEAARELSRRVSYPLTMFALVLVVVAVGHLLINTQPMFASIDDPDASTRVIKATVVCLVIVGLMSVIDLVWTLIANQNGTMRELNPLGSEIINNAGQLIAFKIVITSFSLGLLFWFRENPFARRATWWCCLVLTLLTARWLTFHSLFA